MGYLFSVIEINDGWLVSSINKEIKSTYFMLWNNNINLYDYNIILNII